MPSAGSTRTTGRTPATTRSWRRWHRPATSWGTSTAAATCTTRSAARSFCGRRLTRRELGFRGILEVRADSAFFQRHFLATCGRRQLEYAIKVPMWSWLSLRGIVRKKRTRACQWVDRRNDVQGLFATLPIPTWNRTERIAIYRKRVRHAPAKGRQLELFNPDDGNWEYSVVATNKKPARERGHPNSAPSTDSAATPPAAPSASMRSHG